MGRENFDNQGVKWKAEKLAEVMFHMIDGKTQAEAATLAGITAKTVCVWLSKQPELKGRIKAARNKEIANPFKSGESFPAIKAFTRVHMPDKYTTIEEIERKFCSHLKGL
ncbi:hypothetical protein CJD36_008205 [Flavipsychrobacter stenotrophus]|uniref:Uncharacterized protein n=1 Tax=Flavipsychrobacter stenotrophus TaxID=2077091 RepID=A0A2S7SYT1_9BACT|nr:hypothetical protein [Flavipsychrobacter stenotrophus]PQJ11767.1 hypothetical protein CJD36_008205 [Flavipsychrobacter stenotrophus]